MQCDKRLDRFEYCPICGAKHGGVLTFQRHLADHHRWEPGFAFLLANMIEQRVESAMIAREVADRANRHK